MGEPERQNELMDLLTTIVSFVIVLGILVFFHELGHYWVARRNGIVVEEFGMGYPPRLVKLFTYDGTDFTINLVPFGGFARMRGEDGGDMSTGSFNAAGRGARAATLVAGPLMNALLAIILFAASFMAGFPAAVAYPQLTDVPAASLAAELGLQTGDLLLTSNDTPTLVSTLPDMGYDFWETGDNNTGDNNEAATETVLTISRDGAILNIPVADQSVVSELLDSIQYRPVLDTEIIYVAPESPAEQQGLQQGDLVFQIDGTVVTYQQPLNQIVGENLGTELSITVLRAGDWQTIDVTPRVDPPEGEGALGVQISSLTQLASLPILRSLWEGVNATAQYIMMVVQLPVMLIAGQLSADEARVSGPVEIARLVGDAAIATRDTGLWFPIFRLSAVLSAALAITNMLPLPALDGGRLLFIAIETLRGRRINPEREGLVHMVGFMLLLGLMVYITVQDLRTDSMSIDWLNVLGQ